MRAWLGLCIIIGALSCGNGGGESKATEVKLSDVKLNADREAAADTLIIQRENWWFQFTDHTDPYDLGLYQRLDILKEDSIVITYRDPLVEIQGKEFSNSDRYVIDLDSLLYIMIPIDNRPEPSHYLFLESRPNVLKIIGLSDATTLDTIGDLDHDGRIEFAGFRFHSVFLKPSRMLGSSEHSRFHPSRALP